MEFIKRLKDKKPEYESTFKELINRFTITQGGTAGTASEKEKWNQGKFFSTQYEIYMYATLIGLRHDYRLPLASKETLSFIEIRSFKPEELADYIIMCLIVKSGIDLFALESLDDNEVENQIRALKKLFEEYANGGFDKIRSKWEEDPDFFNNEHCFLDFLEE